MISLLYFFIIFIGFSAGRLGHIFFGPLNSPHHWIFGLVSIALGLIFLNHFFGLVFLCLGIGCFISDLKDFLGFKIWGVDEVTEFKFWGID